MYIPDSPGGPDNTNQHFLVVPLPNGTFLAMWTMGSRENGTNQHMVSSRSTDEGRTWSVPIVIDGPSSTDPAGAGLASWGFPIVAPALKRVYCFYVKNTGVQDVREADTGVLRARWSEDDGKTWSREFHDFEFGRSSYSPTDPKIPQTFIVYQVPFVAPDGTVIAGFTRQASRTVFPGPPGKSGGWDRPSEVNFLHFTNVLKEKDPRKLKILTYPEGNGLRASQEMVHTAARRNVMEEPTVQALSDGRYICVLRTFKGTVDFSLSNDKGKTWSAPDTLRYAPGGTPILNPISPCPLYRLKDGRYLLVFFNNDGGPGGPGDFRKNRTPAWFTVGREIPGHPTHPIRFGTPRILADNGAAPLGTEKRTEIGTYTSFFEWKGKHYFWYPDRKHFLLGKILSEDLLNSADPGAKA